MALLRPQATLCVGYAEAVPRAFGASDPASDEKKSGLAGTSCPVGRYTSALAFV